MSVGSDADFAHPARTPFSYEYTYITMRRERVSPPVLWTTLFALRRRGRSYVLSDRVGYRYDPASIMTDRIDGGRSRNWQPGRECNAESRRR